MDRTQVESIEELGERWRRIYRTLVAAPRRQMIGSLLEADPDGALSLPEAANLPEYRVDPEQLYHNLVHDHLPMMERAGFIEWTEDPFCVERGPRFEEVAAVILAIDEYEDFPNHLVSGCYFHDRTQPNP